MHRCFQIKVAKPIRNVPMMGITVDVKKKLVQIECPVCALITKWTHRDPLQI